MEIVSALAVIISAVVPLLLAWFERQKTEDSIRDTIGGMSSGEVADALARAAARARARMCQKVFKGSD